MFLEMAVILISIIIPVYNCQQYVGFAIQSAINQTWEDKEIIVIDDGSTDHTAAIVKEFDGVQYIYKSNGGTGSALNMGIKLARGDWIKWLSADDILYPHALETMMWQVIDTPDRENCIFYTPYHIINEVGEVIATLKEEPKMNQKEAMLKSFYGNGSSSLIHKKLFERIGYFKEIRHSEDYEFWLRALSMGARMELVPKITLQYRVHPDQLTNKVGGQLNKQLRSQYA